MTKEASFLRMTYFHLFLSTVVTALAREKKLWDSKWATLVFGLIAVLLLFVLLPMSPGIFKYFLFFVFLVAIGQSTIPLVGVLEDKNVLRKTLGMVAGMFLALTVLAFWDNQHTLGFGPYLFAGLVGLLLARVGLWIASAAEAPFSDVKTWDQITSYVGVVLFAGYTAYDTQVLKETARVLKGTPDYVNSSLNLYLDILNLFGNLGDLIAE